MNNIIDTIQTKDGVKYKIERQLFVKYSRFFRTMIQDFNEEVFQLYNISSKEFDFIYEFIQLHKTVEPQPLGKVHPGLPLSNVMQQADAELINRIFMNTPEQVKAIFDAVFFLHIEDLLKRLSVGVLANLKKEETKKLINESHKSPLINQAQISAQIHKKVELILFKNKENKQQQQIVEQC